MSPKGLIAGVYEHLRQNRAGFFAAAGQAMRRIFVESARCKGRRKTIRGGERVPFEDVQLASPLLEEDLLALHEGLHQLAEHHPLAARLVHLGSFLRV